MPGKKEQLPCDQPPNRKTPTMSNDPNRMQYECRKCGYINIWTRDQVLQQGCEVIYRGDDEATYLLRCKNPNGCD